MESMSTSNSVTRSNSVQQRTPTKKTKSKKKPHPVKVVYISNPMKINTSAAEFRALVQELTGQDAESPPDPARFHAAGELHRSSPGPHDSCVLPPPPDPTDFQGQPLPSSIDPFDDDDVFTPQMIDNISALLPATLFYESPHLNHWAKDGIWVVMGV
ncbi:sigma factor binding protein 2, chloroplastic isoform X1 [Cajanus cajan]|nr:sigma factor binding protein 2, chloroplastic isoform X1 [Cajanus cajan]